MLGGSILLGSSQTRRMITGGKRSMYIKVKDTWEHDTSEPEGLKSLYPHKRKIEVYCNDASQKWLQDELVIEKLIDAILDQYEEEGLKT